MADVDCTKGQVVNPPSFYTWRGLKQYYQAQMCRMFKPKCKPEFIATIHERIKNYEKILGSVSTTCRCGALKLLGPDHVQVFWKHKSIGNIRQLETRPLIG